MQHRYLVKYILLLTAFGFLRPVHAQPSKIAELQRKLRIAPDSADYVRKLNSIAFYYHRSNLDSCLLYTHKALEIAIRLRDQKGLSYAYTNMALFHSQKGNPKLDIIYNYYALKIDKAIGDSGAICTDLGNLSSAYRMDGNIPLADQYLHQAIQLGNRFPEEGSVSLDLINYLKFNQLDPSKKDSVRWALDRLCSLTASQPYTLEWYYARLYEIIEMRKELPSAEMERRLNKVATDAYKKGEPHVTLAVYFHMIEDFIPAGYPGDSIGYAEKIFSISKKAGDYQAILMVIDKLYTHYLRAGDPVKLRTYSDMVRELAASQFKDEHELPPVDYLSYFTNEQHQQELRYSEQLEQRAIQQNELRQKNHRLLLRLLKGILILLLVTAGIFCWSWYTSRRHMRQLALLNADITERNIRLKTNDDFKNKLLSVIAHDFRAPLKDIVSTAIDWKAHIPDRDSMMHSISRVEMASRRTLEIFDGILRWIKSQFTDFVYIPVPCDNREMLRQLIADIHQETTDKQLQITFDIPLDATVAADNEMLLFVNRTILQHIIRLTEKGGMVLIKGRQPDGSIQLTVEGQPVAVTADLLHLLDQPEQDDKLILVTCRDFVDKMGGQIWVKADRPDTFAFIYRLPLYG